MYVTYAKWRTHTEKLPCKCYNMSYLFLYNILSLLVCLYLVSASGFNTYFCCNFFYFISFSFCCCCHQLCWHPCSGEWQYSGVVSVCLLQQFPACAHEIYCRVFPVFRSQLSSLGCSATFNLRSHTRKFGIYFWTENVPVCICVGLYGFSWCTAETSLSFGFTFGQY